MNDTMITVLIVLGVLVVFGVISYRAIKSIIGSNLQDDAAKQQVIDNGIVAQAAVIEVWETGIKWDHKHELGLRLNITPPHQAPYEAETVFQATPLEIVQFQPGQTTTVYIDPNNPQNIVIKRRLNDLEVAMAERLGMGEDDLYV